MLSAAFHPRQMALEAARPIFWCQNTDYNVPEAPEVVEVEMFKSSLVISRPRLLLGWAECAGSRMQGEALRNTARLSAHSAHSHTATLTRDLQIQQNSAENQDDIKHN